MTEKTVAQKAHVKPGTTFAAVNPVDDVMGRLGLPPSVRHVALAEADVVCVFIRSGAELESELPQAIEAMGGNAVLWVFFRKGSRAAGHDVNRDDVWAVAALHGMRPVSLLSVDQTWSVFRLRRA